MFNIHNSSPSVQILRGIGDREPPARIVCVEPFNVFLCLVTLILDRRARCFFFEREWFVFFSICLSDSFLPVFIFLYFFKHFLHFF